MKLDSHGQFVTLEGKELGVFASKKGNRWMYRSYGRLIASGLEPAAFVKSFWYRDDYVA